MLESQNAFQVCDAQPFQIAKLSHYMNATSVVGHLLILLLHPHKCPYIVVRRACV